MKTCDLILGDCLEIMDTLPEQSIDCIICDPPYGTTAIQWDKVLDFDRQWDLYDRLLKPKGMIILFGSQPFSAQLICSKFLYWRY